MNPVDRIVELIQSSGMTGISYGKLLGLKKSPLTDWKNGKSNPTAKQIQETAKIFDVSVDYLLGNTEIKKAPAEAEAGDDFLFALSGEVKEFTEEQKQSILDYAKFLKQKYNIK